MAAAPQLKNAKLRDSKWSPSFVKTMQAKEIRRISLMYDYGSHYLPFSPTVMVKCPDVGRNDIFERRRLRRSATCPKSQHIETMRCPDWRTRQFAEKRKSPQLAAD
jgi:hypothetical protein